jgi:hypothetical protein
VPNVGASQLERDLCLSGFPRPALPFGFRNCMRFATHPMCDRSCPSCVVHLWSFRYPLGQPIHDRMPVILPFTAYGLWLDPAMRDVEAIGPDATPCQRDARLPSEHGGEQSRICVARVHRACQVGDTEPAA